MNKKFDVNSFLNKGNIIFVQINDTILYNNFGNLK